jgi:MFS transporter, DHA2 family, multidrug resistance protein
MKELSGEKLVMAGMLLAAANFIVVLDMTIANVAVPHIAGGLAVSGHEGTYVITSYAVAEAISVPLTGWLANRFGTLRVFASGILLFGLFSALCGMANSLGMLVVARILQGLAGGPLMPLSQTLLMLIFPKNKQMTAMAIWSMTTLVAPVLGPIISGYICDSWGWSWTFLINIPLAAICGVMAWIILKPFETPIAKVKIDIVGLLLLVVFVGSLQFMLDEGQNLDWFASTEIVALLIAAVVGFAAFLIWELTEKNPIVDLSVFKYRGFSASVLTISLTFGAFFGSVVLTPLWLQTNMGYTATWAGLAMAANGVLAIIAAPIAAKLASKVDPRKLVSAGVLWLGIVTCYRSFGSSDMTYAQIAVPILIQGMAMPFFFIPLSAIALSSVNQNQIASAAGQMNFLRTLAGAFSTSIVTTIWSNRAAINRTELVGIMPSSSAGSLLELNQLVESQSVMLATNQVFLAVSVIFVLAAAAVWLAPKPQLASPSP